MCVVEELVRLQYPGNIFISRLAFTAFPSGERHRDSFLQWFSLPVPKEGYNCRCFKSDKFSKRMWGFLLFFHSSLLFQ